MRAELFDSEGHIEKAVRTLQLCLLSEAQKLTEDEHLDQALTLLFRAYALKPGLTPMLQSIAEVYDKLGDAESATTCRRGVVPEAAEQQFFASEHHKPRVRISRKASNVQHTKTHGVEKVALRTPLSNGKPRLRPEFRAVHTESKGSAVSVIKNGGVWFDGFNTVVVDDQQDMLLEHIKGNPYVVAETAKHRPEQTLNATVCFLDARSSPIYYHWMIDVLPKFALLKKAGIALESIDFFMVRCQSTFQSDTLEQLGVPADRLLPPWSEGITRCQQLIVPYLKHDRGERFYNGLGLGMASWVPQWLKSTFVASTPVRSNRLYLSRAVRGTRCLTNEDQLTVALEQRGFQCAILETMSVSEQAQLLASAQFVVAPHGAGLSNIAFCQTDTIVVEIFGNYVVPCYWSLSELVGLEYHAYFVDEQAEQTASKEQAHQRAASLISRRDQNIELDVESLLGYLDTLIQQQTLAIAS